MSLFFLRNAMVAINNNINIKDNNYGKKYFRNNKKR